MSLKKLSLGMLSAVAAMAALSAPVFTQAAEYEGERATVTVTRQGKNLAGDNELNASVKTNINLVDTEMQWVTELVLQCEEVSGNGSEGNWHGFFNAPKNEKAQRLADAIKGVGPATAQRLVADGYFSRKPRSWNAFRDTILDAERQYRSGFSHQVLVTYGSENKANLGYGSETNCQMVPQTVLKEVKVKRFFKEARMDFHIVIRSAPLLRGEQESFEIAFDGFSASVTPSSSFNHYSLVSRTESRGGTQAIYQFAGSRLRAQVPNTLQIGLQQQDGELVAIVNNSALDTEVLSRGGSLQVNMEVKRKVSGWKSDESLLSTSAPLSSSQAVTTVKTGLKLSDMNNIYVKYSLQITGSPFYSDNASSTESTR